MKAWLSLGLEGTQRRAHTRSESESSELVGQSQCRLLNSVRLGVHEPSRTCLDSDQVSDYNLLLHLLPEQA